MKKVIYGHRVDIAIYKDLLVDAGIECLVKNEFEEAASAGFGSGLPGNADLFVDEADFEKAEGIINSYKETNP
ncbi:MULTISPECIES: putative signal transducing protein [unclassified Saccharicrinis]|uniref:putative signal transducing protein n=1 Tax=unclassified Saccharicrinis TaxID=2646859 RepID=UPI003D350DC0